MDFLRERQRGFERESAHDGRQEVLSAERGDHAIAEWAAGSLCRNRADTDAYVRTLLRCSITDTGHAATISKLSADLEDHAESSAIRSTMDDLSGAATSTTPAEN